MNKSKGTPASEYLKSKGLKNPPLDSGISGGGDAPRQYTSMVMQDYAELYAQQQPQQTEWIEDAKREIQHIFDSGANEIRILEMMQRFINRNNP